MNRRLEELGFVLTGIALTFFAVALLTYLTIRVLYGSH